MLEQIQSDDDLTNSRVPGQVYLCLHGHFYQPPRENPFTDQIPLEAAATPFATACRVLRGRTSRRRRRQRRWSQDPKVLQPPAHRITHPSRE